MRFLLLTPAEALQIRGGDEAAALAPRLVEIGPYAGKSVLPLSVIDDPDHADKAEVFGLLPVVDIDPAEAWTAVDV